MKIKVELDPIHFNALTAAVNAQIQTVTDALAEMNGQASAQVAEAQAQAEKVNKRKQKRRQKELDDETAVRANAEARKGAESTEPDAS